MAERSQFEVEKPVSLERPIEEQLPDLPEQDEPELDARLDPDDDVAVMTAFLRDQRAITPTQAIGLGKQVMARVNRRGEFAAQKRKLKKLQRQVKDLTNRKYDLLDASPSPGDPDDPEYAERVRERGAALDEVERINVEKQGVYAQMREVSPNLARLRREAVVRELRAIRPEFGEGQLNDDVRVVSEAGAFNAVSRILPNLPKEWVDQSNEAGTLTIGSVGSHHPEGRAYYQHGRRLTAGEGWLYGGGGPMDREERISTALHEFGHRVEHTSPELPNGLTKIVQTEKTFHAMRTRKPNGQDDPLVPIHGRENELGRPDRYFSEYVGREYPESAEILSMGLEGLFFGKGDAWEKDPEHLQFVLGLLAAA